MVIRFTPTIIGDFTASLVISSNDADSPEVTVSITGGGVDEITTPNAIVSTTTTATVTIADTDSLDFTDQAAVDALIALGRIARDFGDLIEAVDINPFVALEAGRGGYALDGLGVARGRA